MIQKAIFQALRAVCYVEVAIGTFRLITQRALVILGMHLLTATTTNGCRAYSNIGLDYVF